METGYTGPNGRHVRLRAEVASEIVLDHVSSQRHITGVGHVGVFQYSTIYVVVTAVQVGFHKESFRR